MYTYRCRGGVHIFDSHWYDRETQQEARHWCHMEFGQGDRDPALVDGRIQRSMDRWAWFDRGARIIVWDADDAFVFRMRWC